jgi:hypothetical protein
VTSREGSEYTSHLLVVVTKISLISSRYVVGCTTIVMGKVRWNAMRWKIECSDADFVHSWEIIKVSSG